jgi:hypothetical protein
MTLHLQKPLEDYIQFFERISERSLGLLDQLVEPNVYFSDPFNEVTGVENMKKIFKHMFKTVRNPKFRVLDRAFGGDEKTVYLKWVFTGESKMGPLEITGMSEILFSNQGRVLSHIDHWDAGQKFYERIPVLGAVLRLIKKQLSV